MNFGTNLTLGESGFLVLLDPRPMMTLTYPSVSRQLVPDQQAWQSSWQRITGWWCPVVAASTATNRCLPLKVLGLCPAACHFRLPVSHKIHQRVCLWRAADGAAVLTSTIQFIGSPGTPSWGRWGTDLARGRRVAQTTKSTFIDVKGKARDAREILWRLQDH